MVETSTLRSDYATVREESNSILINRNKEGYLADFYDAMRFAGFAIVQMLLLVLIFWRFARNIIGFVYVGDGLLLMSLLGPRLTYLFQGVRPLSILFSDDSQTIVVNGEQWARYTEVGSIIIETCISLQGFRRFRLRITTIQFQSIVLLESAFWADGLNISELRDQVRKDRIKFKYSNGMSWRSFMNGMTGYDQNSPDIKLIFEVYLLLSTAVFHKT